MVGLRKARTRDLLSNPCASPQPRLPQKLPQSREVTLLQFQATAVYIHRGRVNEASWRQPYVAAAANEGNIKVNCQSVISDVFRFTAI